MTKLVERITIEIEFDDELSALELPPRTQLRNLWSALGHILDIRGKWCLSGPGVSCRITNLGVEEMPEEGGGDN